MGKVKWNSSALVVTIVILSVLWQIGQGDCCIGGRYGRYENWPTNSDWDELLMLLTGKYGKNGWGWQATNSYAYSSLGDYPSGSQKYSSTPWESSGSGSSSGIYPSYQGSSINSLSSGSYSSDSASKHSTTDKFKNALRSYFKSKVTSSGGWTSSGGIGSSGGFVGESFIDSPGPGPPYAPSPHDNSAGGKVQFVPAYVSSAWPSGSPGGSNTFINSPPLGGNDYQSSWPLPQGTSTSRPHHSTSPNNNFSSGKYSITPSNNYITSGNSGSKNQFQSDYDAFGRDSSEKKRRRQGRRRSHRGRQQQQNSPQNQSQKHNTRTAAAPPPPRRQRTRQSQAGLRTKPVNDTSSKKPFKFPPFPGSRKQRRMGRLMSLMKRKLDTSFGGYKIDHSRIRFG